MADPMAALLARQDILDVLHRYCRGIDRRQPELLKDCFHDDSVHDQGGFKGPSHDFCAIALERVTPLPVSHHQLGSVLIELAGDVAESEAYFTAFHRVPATGPGQGLFTPTGSERDLFVGGRYLDTWARRDGRWRITSRRGVYDWQGPRAAS